MLAQQIIILGAGGHARTLLSGIRTKGFVVVGCVAPEKPLEGGIDVDYLGNDDVLIKFDPAVTLLVNGVGSTSSTQLRRRIYDVGKKKGFRFLTILHPQALMSENVELHEGAQVMAGAILQPGSSIGANTIINTGAIIDHDCKIGAHVHVAPGCCLSGAVFVGEGAHVGVGASVIQGVSIGVGALVAAGAVVIRPVPAGIMVAGVPARPMRGPQEI